MSECILQMEHITKYFTGVTALDDVNLSCRKGKIHVLAGENGAGKSTILKILAGVYPPDKGTIRLRGKEVRFSSPLDAQKAGIAMVFQELTQINELTIFENVFLGSEPRRAGLIDRAKQMELLQRCMDKYDLQLNPATIVDRLSVGQKQLAEILKTLVRDPEILILDEPTSALTKEEVEILFRIMRRLADEGKAVIFISHRMEEMFRIGDEVTIFKDGQFVDHCAVSELTTDSLIRKMIGRTLQDVFPPHCAQPGGETILEVKGYKLSESALPVDFQVKKGEIIGIAGLAGHGQTEFINSLSGLYRSHGGSITLNGRAMHISSSSAAVKNGIALVPSDRKQEGLMLFQSIRNNIAIGSIDRRKRLGFLVDNRAERKTVEEYRQLLKIKMAAPAQPAVELSGGNQQKVVLAKELAIQPALILFDEPTKGIDVGSKREFYYIMRDLADHGVAVILYSSDLMEVIGLSDKVLVMYENNVTAQLVGAEITEENIMRHAMGISKKREGSRHAE
jgi:ABC-type sugar transport system ATPase subunit